MTTPNAGPTSARPPRSGRQATDGTSHPNSPSVATQTLGALMWTACPILWLAAIAGFIYYR